MLSGYTESYNIIDDNGKFLRKEKLYFIPNVEFLNNVYENYVHFGEEAYSAYKLGPASSLTQYHSKLRELFKINLLRDFDNKLVISKKNIEGFELIFGYFQYLIYTQITEDVIKKWAVGVTIDGKIYRVPDFSINSETWVQVEKLKI